MASDSPKLELLKLRAKVGAQIGDLVEDERWKQLIETVRVYQRKGIFALMSQQMDQHRMGYWQGYLAALAVFTQTKGQNERDTVSAMNEIGAIEADSERLAALDDGRLPEDVMNELREAIGLATNG